MVNVGTGHSPEVSAQIQATLDAAIPLGQDVIAAVDSLLQRLPTLDSKTKQTILDALDGAHADYTSYLNMSTFHRSGDLETDCRRSLVKLWNNTQNALQDLSKWSRRLGESELPGSAFESAKEALAKCAVPTPKISAEFEQRFNSSSIAEIRVLRGHVNEMVMQLLKPSDLGVSSRTEHEKIAREIALQADEMTMNTFDHQLSKLGPEEYGVFSCKIEPTRIVLRVENPRPFPGAAQKWADAQADSKANLVDPSSDRGRGYRLAVEHKFEFSQEPCDNGREILQFIRSI